MNQVKGTKQICYRGGIARFVIPATWNEEYDPPGGATFYEDRPDSGTLRLSVLQFESKGSETCEQMIASLILRSGYESLRDELAVRHYAKSTVEDDEQLQIHYWEVGVPIEPNSVRLAIFSYTILASQAEDHAVLEEIELLDHSIRDAEYSRDAGISGDYDAD